MCPMAAAEGKGKKITLLALPILLGLLFLAAGQSKLFNPQMHVQDFEAWGYALWFISVIGVIEVVGGVLLLAPLAGSSQRTRFYGSLLLAVDMLGATATHLRAGQANRFPVPLVLCILCSVVAYFARAADKAKVAGA
jgi:uncharacterized membrane protein YphA (DoxX/SURF4 family)